MVQLPHQNLNWIHSYYKYKFNPTLFLGLQFSSISLILADLFSLKALGVQLVQIEMCCKYNIYTRPQRLSAKENIEYLLIFNIGYMLTWQHPTYVVLNKILSK